MNRTRTLFARLAIVALSTLALAACETNPAKPEPAKPIPVAPAPAKSLVEMQYELDKAAMELETTKTMALIKFADESKSDYAKGLVSGLINGGAGTQAPAAAPRQSFIQVAQQQQRQAAEIELRTEEMKERNSLWNKGLQVFDRAVGYRMFSKGLDFQKYQLDQSNSQQRYTLDTVANTSLSSQQSAYEFNSRVPYFFSLPAGSTGVAPVAAPE